ncbi:probable signaling protein [Ruminococcus sp. CAG:624]|nr:probable signaling protein [Ruminococcus sp. CAG:624]
MENDRKFRDLLKQLKENGFSASLDDFGTGYSSINMLKNMDFNVLKLDKSFIADEKVNDEREKVILKNIISMAKELKLEVISEGVETIEQINYLKQLKCEQAQGYFFDKPLPRDKFEERLLKECYLV